MDGDFIVPETRNDFFVDLERKKLWKSLYDILLVVAKICNRHGLRFYLDSGTLLGAARHQGFIPWDDDLDIAMFRSDYDKLIEVLPEELPEQLFMQSSLTDPDYDITHIKIRDGRFSAIAPYHVLEGRRYNMGVFIDVFPIDGAPESEKLKTRQLRSLKRLKVIFKLAARHRYSNIKQKLCSIGARLIFRLVGRQRLYAMREKVLSRYSTGQYEDGVLAMGEWGYRCSRKRSWYEKCVYLPFEGEMFPCPYRYGECLEGEYGDWHKMVKGGGEHGELEFDLDHDYQTILHEKYGY